MNFCEVATMLQNELIKMRTDLRAGKISAEKASMDLTIIAGIDKLQNTILKTKIMERKLKVQLRQSLLPPIDVEVDRIICHDRDGKIITRADCLSFSGDSANMESCRSCENFKYTRELLLPERANGMAA